MEKKIVLGHKSLDLQHALILITSPDTELFNQQQKGFA